MQRFEIKFQTFKRLDSLPLKTKKTKPDIILKMFSRFYLFTLRTILIPFPLYPPTKLPLNNKRLHPILSLPLASCTFLLKCCCDNERREESQFIP